VTLHLLHIPKTGGTALALALYGHVVRHGHTVRLDALPAGGQAIVFVRDPVARFVSAFDFARRADEQNRDGYFRQVEAFASVSDFALRGDHGHPIFRPLTWWLDDLADPRLYFVGRTEHLERDFAVLASLMGLHDRNLPPLPAHPGSTLSAMAEAYIRERYADDYALLEDLPWL